MSLVLPKQKPRHAGELVHYAALCLRATGERRDLAGETSYSKMTEELGRSLYAVRTVFQGEDPDASPEALTLATTEAFREDFLSLLVERLGALDWEGRKNVVHIWSSLLHYNVGTAKRGVLYVERHPELLDYLLQGYDDRELAMSSGAMLREAIRHESLAKCFMERPSFYDIFAYIDLPNFDAASDAFMSLKDLLRRHKDLVAVRLLAAFSEFFEHYESLLKSANYVTRRQALKLLGEVLLDRVNVMVMLKYISDPHNLRLIMTLLKDPRKSIQFEAFHVFKVFAANPNKPEAIVRILARNRVRLLEFLRDFHVDKEEDQFEEEKELLVREIEQLPTAV